MRTPESARHIAIGVFPSQTLVAVWHPSPHMDTLHIMYATAHANTCKQFSPPTAVLLIVPKRRLNRSDISN